MSDVAATIWWRPQFPAWKSFNRCSDVIRALAFLNISKVKPSSNIWIALGSFSWLRIERVHSIFFVVDFGDGSWRHTEAWIVLLAGVVKVNTLAQEALRQVTQWVAVDRTPSLPIGRRILYHWAIAALSATSAFLVVLRFSDFCCRGICKSCCGLNWLFSLETEISNNALECRRLDR